MKSEHGRMERERLHELFGPALADYTPVIEDLEVTDVSSEAIAGETAVRMAQPPPGTITIDAQFDFTDLDGDIDRVKGETRFELGGAAAAGVYALCAPSPAVQFNHPGSGWNIDSLTTGHAQGSVDDVPDDHNQLSVYVTDDNGNQSNTLTEPYSTP